ncbi:DnaA N-terminal domain-containing protein [Parvibaculum sp.]|uniref:DnaA N-terminal domain-containing protein n=1 Tax=Parvibaculum sp. TaxID=2024848 RepID=UPI001E0C2898|nr:DnaA N-terminal domain-containing protein [Parvibaculum sp.]MBX3488882.1 hypothetical protein [Parvibaculum sp.]
MSEDRSVYGRFCRVPPRARHDARLVAGDFRLLLECAFRTKPDGQFVLAQGKLAAEWNVTRQYISRCMMRLVGFGYLRRGAPREGTRGVWAYEMIFDEDADPVDFPAATVNAGVAGTDNPEVDKEGTTDNPEVDKHPATDNPGVDKEASTVNAGVAGTDNPEVDKHPATDNPGVDKEASTVNAGVAGTDNPEVDKHPTTDNPGVDKPARLSTSGVDSTVNLVGCTKQLSLTAKNLNSEPRARTRGTAALEALQAEIGPAAFNSWFAKARLDVPDDPDDPAQLSVPTRFLANYIRQNFADRLERLLGRRIEFAAHGVRSPGEAAGEDGSATKGRRRS